MLETTHFRCPHSDSGRHRSARHSISFFAGCAPPTRWRTVPGREKGRCEKTGSEKKNGTLVLASLAVAQTLARRRGSEDSRRPILAAITWERTSDSRIKLVVRETASYESPTEVILSIDSQE